MQFKWGYIGKPLKRRYKHFTPVFLCWLSIGFYCNSKCCFSPIRYLCLDTVGPSSASGFNPTNQFIPGEPTRDFPFLYLGLTCRKYAYMCCFSMGAFMLWNSLLLEIILTLPYIYFKPGLPNPWAVAHY